MKADKQGYLADKSLGNAATALILLQEWLSISESQICSTEVLSEHLPKVNLLLESSMDSISTHFSKIAGLGREISDEVNNIAENVGFVEIDGNKVAISECIKNITDGDGDEMLARLKKLGKAIEKHENQLEEKTKIMQQAIEKNTAEISQIVTGMQFQDRVSQNIMITINIMKTISEFLDREITNSLPNISKTERKKLLNKEFTQELLQKFRLGELQHSFVDHLVSHGYINNASDVGFSAKDFDKKSTTDDVELF